MNKLHQKSDGIAHLAVVLLLIIVSMIGGVGYYVYSASKDNNKLTSLESDSSKAAEKQAEASAKAKEEADNLTKAAQEKPVPISEVPPNVDASKYVTDFGFKGIRVISGENTFTAVIPMGWQLLQPKKMDRLMTTGPVSYRPDVTTPLISYFEPVDDSIKNFVIQIKSVKSGGTPTDTPKLTKTAVTEPDVPRAKDELLPGTVVKTYTQDFGDFKVVTTYNRFRKVQNTEKTILHDEKDETEIVEKFITSIKRNK